jgi:hypothetical protein
MGEVQAVDPSCPNRGKDLIVTGGAAGWDVRALCLTNGSEDNVSPLGREDGRYDASLRSHGLHEGRRRPLICIEEVMPCRQPVLRRETRFVLVRRSACQLF